MPAAQTAPERPDRITLDERTVQFADIIEIAERKWPGKRHEEIYLPFPTSANEYDVVLSTEEPMEMMRHGELWVYPRIALSEVISFVRSQHPDVDFKNIRIGWGNGHLYVTTKP